MRPRDRLENTSILFVGIMLGLFGGLLLKSFPSWVFLVLIVVAFVVAAWTGVQAAGDIND